MVASSSVFVFGGAGASQLPGAVKGKGGESALEFGGGGVAVVVCFCFWGGGGQSASGL